MTPKQVEHLRALLAHDDVTVQRQGYALATSFSDWSAIFEGMGVQQDGRLAIDFAPITDPIMALYFSRQDSLPTTVETLTIESDRLSHLDALAPLTNLKELVLCCPRLTNLEGLMGLNKLEKLNLTGCSKISDLLVLDQLPLLSELRGLSSELALEIGTSAWQLWLRSLLPTSGACSLQVRLCMRKGEGEWPTIGTLPEADQDIERVRKDMQLWIDLEAIEECTQGTTPILAQRIIHTGLEPSIAGDGLTVAKGEIDGYPSPVVAFVVSCSVSDMQKPVGPFETRVEAFRTGVMSSSYAMEIAGCNDGEPWFWEDHNGYTSVWAQPLAFAPSLVVLECDLQSIFELDVEAADEESDERMALLRDQVRAQLEAIGQALGLTAMRSLLNDKGDSALLRGDYLGSLWDCDPLLLAASSAADLAFDATDFTNELTQSYYRGEHDEGSLSCPGELATYAEYARRQGIRVLPVLRQTQENKASAQQLAVQHPHLFAARDLDERLAQIKAHFMSSSR